MSSAVYRLAVEETLRALILSGITANMTPQRTENCRAAFDRLLPQLASLGLSEEDFRKACIEAGRNAGKTMAILDWIEYGGEEA